VGKLEWTIMGSKVSKNNSPTHLARFP